VPLLHDVVASASAAAIAAIALMRVNFAHLASSLSSRPVVLADGLKPVS